MEGLLEYLGSAGVAHSNLVSRQLGVVNPKVSEDYVGYLERRQYGGALSLKVHFVP
jgi:hypothetical protein